jgi:predicted peroxiredoxin
MKIGILVNTNNHLDAVVGITRAAVAKGHEVSLFSMDDGSRLFSEKDYIELHKLEGVRMSFCSHNAEGMGISTVGLPEAIVSGSQYNNAEMNNEADRVIVL